MWVEHEKVGESKRKKECERTEHDKVWERKLMRKCMSVGK